MLALLGLPFQPLMAMPKAVRCGSSIGAQRTDLNGCPLICRHSPDLHRFLGKVRKKIWW
jgi:hypothetical protein